MGGTFSGCSRVAPPRGGVRDATQCARGMTCSVHEEVAQGCGVVGNLFFEPEGTITKETWQFVGEGRGGFEKMQTYSYVGDGQGTFDKEASQTSYGGGVKKFCTGLFIAFVVATLGYVVLTMNSSATAQEMEAELLNNFVHTTGEPDAAEQPAAPATKQGQPAAAPHQAATTTHIRGAAHSGSSQPAAAATSPTVAEAAAAAAAGAGVAGAAATGAGVAGAAATSAAAPVAQVAAPKYVCATTEDEARVQSAILAEWATTDVDRNGRVTRTELMAQKSTLSEGTLDLLLDADVDGNGWLSNEEFTAALAHSGKVKPKQGQDGGHDELLHSDVATWSSAKKEWCCTHMAVACQPSGEGQASSEKSKQGHQKDSTQENATPKFDCKQEEDWETKWSQAHQSWCCHDAKIGCPAEEHKAKGPGPDPYDCNAGLKAWEAGWSVGKKDWCCRHHQKGCQESAMDAYDCNDGHHDQEEEWSDNKKSWCCKNKDIGCTESTPKPEEQHHAAEKPKEQYECDGESSKFTSEQKEWCCKHKATSCAKDREDAKASGEESDKKHAEDDYQTEEEKDEGCSSQCSSNDRTGTCRERIQWSSTHLFKDTPEACTKAFEKVVLDCPVCSSCSLAQAHCTVSASTPPPDSTTQPVLFDCDAGYDQWEKGWSISKKTWCCANRQKGCTSSNDSTPSSTSESPPPPPLPPAATTGDVVSKPFDCKVALANWQSAWSEAKKTWCCVHKGSGCAPTATTPAQAVTTPAPAATAATTAATGKTFDCMSGFATWSWGWSDEKKHWCCAHEGKACPATPPPGSAAAAAATTAAPAALYSVAAPAAPANPQPQPVVQAGIAGAAAVPR